jgi:Ca2+-binding RTX toxin-like protein
VRSLGSGTFQNIDRLSIAGTDFSDYLDASGSVQQTTISGGGGNDFIFGGTNNDLLIGGLGNDVIVGGAGDDEIRGGAGADQLFGGIGDDILFGGAGGDLLNGYGGGALEKDVLSGGGRDLRRDTFVLGDASAIFYRNSGNNDFAVITDFERGFDIIQLRGAATAYELVAEVSVVVGMTTYTGTGIYSLSGGSDLIGVVQGAISLDLENSRQFVYV